MKKKIGIIISCVLCLAALNSCCTVNEITHTSCTAELGNKVGEANSKVILGFIGGGGSKATLKDACRNGDIKKINHVEITHKRIFFGVVNKKTTRVYGD